MSLEGDISGSSVEKIDDTDEVTPTEDKLNRIHSNLQKCIRELDKSFEYLMFQADDIEKNKTDQVRVVEPFLRPSSAGPLFRSSPRARRDVTKRAFLPPELVTMMMSPLPSLAGARAMIFLSVFHSEISRASQPFMKTPTRSWANQR